MQLTVPLLTLSLPLLVPLITALPSKLPNPLPPFSLLPVHAPLHYRTEECTLTLSLTGAVTGAVGQYDNGQAISSPSVQGAVLTFRDGALYDDQGRGCWWTPPSSVLQCDVNQVPDTPFSLTCPDSYEGAAAAVTYAGQSAFYACLADESTATWNVYSLPNQGGTCVEVQLTAAGECVETCTPPTSYEEDVDTVSNEESGTETCDALVLADYEFPHLILPVSSSTPTAPASTSFSGSLAPGTAVLFSFDIPPSTPTGATCSLIFLLPEQATDPVSGTSAYSLSGSGDINFSRLASAPAEGVTWDTAPAVEEEYGVVTLVPGKGKVVASFTCPAGEAVGVRMEVGMEGDTCFDWFQDSKADGAVGVYLTVC